MMMMMIIKIMKIMNDDSDDDGNEDYVDDDDNDVDHDAFSMHIPCLFSFCFKSYTSFFVAAFNNKAIVFLSVNGVHNAFVFPSAKSSSLFRNLYDT